MTGKRRFENSYI